MKCFGLKMMAAALTCAAAACMAGAQNAPKPAYLDTSLSAEQRAADLVQKMTLAEKATQLVNQARPIPRLNIPEYDWWSEALHGVAQDGTTEFPEPIGLAATFDTSAIHRMAEVIGTEGRIKHVQAVRAKLNDFMTGLDFWAPNVNIVRDPRWGRGQETYGEDPYLTGLLGSEFVRGIQGPDGFYRRADATLKHFAAHSGPESVRDGFNARVSEHDLADTYLPAFRALTGPAHADAMMCSYNAINGTPACANAGLIEDRARKQWGFAGYVVSDCDAVDEITEYLHATPDHAHGTAAALKAGVDLDCGGTYNHLNEALKDHLIDEQDVDRALRRLFLARLRLGMLQPASCSPYAATGTEAVNTPEDRALSLRAAEESMVLLKNEGNLLPLDFAGKRVAVVAHPGYPEWQTE